MVHNSKNLGISTDSYKKIYGIEYTQKFRRYRCCNKRYYVKNKRCSQSYTIDYYVENETEAMNFTKRWYWYVKHFCKVLNDMDKDSFIDMGTEYFQSTKKR